MAKRGGATSTTRYGVGDGKGTGWGGPARGAGNGSPPFQATGDKASTNKPTDRSIERELRRLVQAEQVLDEIHRIAMEGKREGDRINAGTAFLNRVEGTPVQRTITAEVDDSRLVINVMTDFHGRD